MRRSGEEKEKKSGRLSSRNRIEAIDEKAERREKDGSESGNQHLWNSCGSETGKDERKQTACQVPITGRMDEKSARMKGKDREPKGELSTGKSNVRRNREEEGTEETEAE